MSDVHKPPAALEVDERQLHGGPRGSRRDEHPVLLNSASPAIPFQTETAQAVVSYVSSEQIPIKPVPKGWPVKQVVPVWWWLGQPRPPLSVVLAGCEGGVGTTTLAALLGDVFAAGSFGPALLVDQCGTPWGALSRRLLGQRLDPAGGQVLANLQAGVPAAQVLQWAPRTSAGAAVVIDTPESVPLGELYQLVRSASGAMVVDAGVVNPALSARLSVQPVVVMVGRADLVGAEALCAGLRWISSLNSVQLLVALVSTSPTDVKQVTLAQKLVGTAVSSQAIVHVPFDDRLVHSQNVRLDRVKKTTVTALLKLITMIRLMQEGFGHAR